jgi:hypothetical protein
MQTSDTRRTVALLAATVAPWLAPAAQAAGDDQQRSFEIYGFAQLDWIQDSKRMDPAWVDAFRPSKIATPEGEFGTNGEASLSVKQSRFGVRGNLPTADNSPPVKFKFEFDLFGVGVDAGQTTFRLRYAYGEWGQWLAGQTTSLFMDLDVFPNVIDYWGPNGIIFLRHPQIRWTPYRTDSSWFAVALEQPSNDVDPGNIRLVEEFQNATVNPKEVLPDLTAQYQYGADWGHLQLSGILRDIGYEYRQTPSEPFQKGSQTGWGVNLSGAWKPFGPDNKDQLLWQVVHGNGIASYMNDGGMDLAPTATYPAPTTPPLPTAPTLDGEAVPMTGVEVYYDHWWNSRFSTSIGYSMNQVTNTNFQATDAYHKGQYASVNLLFYPTERVMAGVELLWGERTDNDGTTGTDARFQFSAKYTFDAKIQ